MVLPVRYSDLLILVLALFAFVGFMRGWYREGITSIFVAILALLVWKPEMAKGIVETINKFLKLVIMFIKSGFSTDPSQIMAQSVSPDLLLDPNSYRLYIGFTAIMVLVSYIVGDLSFKGKITPLGRLIGGILGLANGYVLLSLIKQFIVNYLQSQGEFFAQSDQLAVRVTNVPAESFLAGYGIIFVFVVLVGVIALLIAGDRLKLPLK
jgi:hypothetical protein